MKRSLLLLGACSLGFMLNSCCCFINGQEQDVQIKSNVPNADIFINGVIHGSTPGTVTLERDEVYDLEMRKEGYYPYRQKLDADFSGWFAGNLIFGGLVGMIIDLGAGTCWSFDDVQANLTPITLTPEVAPTVSAPLPTQQTVTIQKPVTVAMPQTVTPMPQPSNQVIRPQRPNSPNYMNQGVDYVHGGIQNTQQVRDNVSTSSQPMDGFFDSVLGEN